MRFRSVTSRLFAIVGLSVIGLGVLSVLSAVLIERQMLEGSIAKTASLVATAKSVAKAFHERAMAGEFDEAKAQELAKVAIRGMSKSLSRNPLSRCCRSVGEIFSLAMERIAVRARSETKAL